MDSKSKYMDMDSDNNSIKFIDITRKSIDIGVIYVVYFIYAFVFNYIILSTIYCFELYTSYMESDL